MIGIIKYGMGNITSVKNALDFLNVPSCFVDSRSSLESCDKIILPGVGAFAQAMQNLEDLKLVEPITEFVQLQKKPILGLCLGMQLLFENSSEHGLHNGLGFVKGNVRNLREKVEMLPIPHIGWNSLTCVLESKLLNGLPADELIFYFVHSYYCCANDRSVVTAITDYGISFDSIIEVGNIYGCQFHPEKSQKSGLKILNNFSCI